MPSQRNPLVLLFSILLLVPALQLLAQPTLTLNSQMPVIGDVANFKFGQVTNFSPGPAGANQTWDFSNFSLNGGSFEFLIIEPADAFCGAAFPEAESAWFFPAFEGTNFYKVSGQSIQQIGVANGNPLDTISKTTFTVPEEVLQFPATYQTTYTYASEYTITGLGVEIDDRREGTVEFDGYGTLITPDGTTYQNVLRMRVVSSTDLIPFFDDVQYSWLIPGRFLPLMVFNEPGDGEETPFLYYAVENPNALPEWGSGVDLGLRIAGNPVGETLQLINEQPIPETAKLRVLDQSGRVVYSGAYQDNLSVANQPPGTYYLILESRRGRQVLPFIKA